MSGVFHRLQWSLRCLGGVIVLCNAWSVIIDYSGLYRPRI